MGLTLLYVEDVRDLLSKLRFFSKSENSGQRLKNNDLLSVLMHYLCICKWWQKWLSQWLSYLRVNGSDVW